MTIQLDKITEIIESEKNKFIESKSDLSTKENLVYFKEKIGYSFSHMFLKVFFTFSLIMTLSLKFDHSGDSHAPDLIILYLLFSITTSFLFLETIKSNFMKKYINIPYVFYKLTTKKYKEKKLFSTLKCDFLDSTISIENLNKISKCISKKDMLEFLDTYKRELSYRTLLKFCKDTKHDKKDSNELLTKLVDNIYKSQE